MNEIEEVISAIKAKVSECEETGNMFEMPEITIPGVVITPKEYRGDGLTLYHTDYHIAFSNGVTINVEYKSKDKCRCYSVRPDRSYIVVKCSNPAFDFSDAWDENS